MARRERCHHLCPQLSKTNDARTRRANGAAQRGEGPKGQRNVVFKTRIRTSDIPHISVLAVVAGGWAEEYMEAPDSSSKSGETCSYACPIAESLVPHRSVEHVVVSLQIRPSSPLFQPPERTALCILARLWFSSACSSERATSPVVAWFACRVNNRNVQ